MNTQRTPHRIPHRGGILLLMLLTALALVGCQVFSTGKPVAPAAGQPDPKATAPAGSATEAVVQLASPTAPVAAESRTRGNGDFSLMAPTTGLYALSRYSANLQLTFDGTRDGAPYALKETYDQVVDRAAATSLLTRVSLSADGASSQVFSGAVGGLRYVQPAADQPCRVGLLDENSGALFEPAAVLPKLEGATAAGEETVNGVPAKVYTFDGLALNAGPDAEASGKLWVASSGGWLVKYELSLRSARLFGEGISGEQQWIYEVREVDTAVASLPESCPRDLVDLPLPDGAQVTRSLPNFMQLNAAQGPAELAAFYQDTLTAQYWIKQGEPVVSEAGTRLVFSRAVQDKEQMAVITIKDAQVTIFELLTDAVPAQ